MTERIAVTEETKEKLNEFKKGAGMSYDETIALLLELATLEGENLEGSGAELGFAKRRGHKVSKITIVRK